jgi:glycosyltransferase involved in cell wall biosynthesis
VKTKIALLHPYILHYREEFFEEMMKNYDLDIFCYEDPDKIKESNFKQANIITTAIQSIRIGPFLIYDPRVFLRTEYDVLVLMLNFTHITTWILLLTKFIHKKKIITWGHGISVKRYVNEEKNPSFLMRTLIKLSDGLWFYTKKEMMLWKKYYPNKLMVSLDNTISYIDNILNTPEIDKETLKQKYKINTAVNFIFCARFNEPARRVDLLVTAINALRDRNFGFIIIGEGSLKPDFSRFSNVYDFGSVYEKEVKDDLFAISDIYFQPGWVGLSIVEAMAYGKPVFTFRRTQHHLQCVEYSYIIDTVNGLIFDSMDCFIETSFNISSDEITRMSRESKRLVSDELRSYNMVSNASVVLEKLGKKSKLD